jgi:hypothetical protein
VGPGGQCCAAESQLALLSIMMIHVRRRALAAELCEQVDVLGAHRRAHRAAMAAAATERWKKVVFFNGPPERGSCYRQELARSVAVIRTPTLGWRSRFTVEVEVVVPEDRVCAVISQTVWPQSDIPGVVAPETAASPGSVARSKRGRPEDRRSARRRGSRAPARTPAPAERRGVFRVAIAVEIRAQ